MRRSPLEMRMHILDHLNSDGNTPKKLTQLMYKTNVNCSVLKEILGIYIEEGVVAQIYLTPKRNGYRPIHARFNLTDKGKAVLGAYKELLHKFNDVTIAEPFVTVSRAVEYVPNIG